MMHLLDCGNKSPSLKFLFIPFGVTVVLIICDSGSQASLLYEQWNFLGSQDISKSYCTSMAVYKAGHAVLCEDKLL